MYWLVIKFQASYKYSAWINLCQSSRSPSQSGTIYHLHFIDEEIEALGEKFLTQGHSITKWESDLEFPVWCSSVSFPENGNHCQFYHCAFQRKHSSLYLQHF